MVQAATVQIQTGKCRCHSEVAAQLSPQPEIWGTCTAVSYRHVSGVIKARSLKRRTAYFSAYNMARISNWCVLCFLLIDSLLYSFRKASRMADDSAVLEYHDCHLGK